MDHNAQRAIDALREAEKCAESLVEARAKGDVAEVMRAVDRLESAEIKLMAAEAAVSEVG